jgi:hypothetical protein
MDLSKEQIFAAGDITVKEVKVSEWGGVIHVRMMSGDERDAYEGSASQPGQKFIRARLVQMTACDAAGNLLFTPDDLPKISAKAGAALDRVFAAAARHNRITPADIEELKKGS